MKSTSLSTCLVCLALPLLPGMRAAVYAEEPIPLREAFAAGYQYHVSSRVELTGSLTMPSEKDKPAPKPLTVTGESALDYDERVLAVNKDGEVQKTARIYRRIDFQRKVGEQPQQNTIRPAVRRLVILRHQNQEVPFSPDGPLLWGEIDLVRTDVFTPALTGLLPSGAVRVGDRWTAANTAIQELTDLERIDEGKVECRLEEILTLDRRRHARVSFAGTVRGTNEDGPNRQQLDGYLYFDLESNHVSYVSLEGISSLLDKEGKELGRIKGRFTLTRQVNQKAKDLSDEALKGLAVEPDAENTRLLFEDPDLGLRLLYPRRFHIAGSGGVQVGLDGADGNGMLLTVETAAKLPTAAQFLNESREWLQKEKAKVIRVDPPQRLQAAPAELDHFAIEAEVAGQRVLLDYYVLRQREGGVTLAARLLPGDLEAVRKDVERIARSLAVTKEIKAPQPK